MARVWPQDHKENKSSQIKFENMLSALHPDIKFRLPVALSHVNRFLVVTDGRGSEAETGDWNG